MLAWKFFSPGTVAPFTGVRWPLPPSDGGGAGWVEARSLKPGAGVHACALEDLPYWIDRELWLVELQGDLTRARRQLVAARGRLIAPVREWSAVEAEFTGACIERTRRRVVDALLAEGREGEATLLLTAADAEAERQAALAIATSGPSFVAYVADVIRRRPYPGTCAYMAANAAAAIGGVQGHDEERAEQAAWMSRRLKLQPPR
jgi:hypothetical protein